MMRESFKKRRDLAVRLMNEIDGLSVVNRKGAFYLFVNISKIEKDSMKFCLDMLESVGVATVPGIGFGSDGYFRFSYATDNKSIELGIKKIGEFIKNYNK
jgi:aspartate aminotransferase